MTLEEIPIQEIAELFERDPAEIELAYREWSEQRNRRGRTLVPDLRLLAGFSNLSTASVSNFMRNKPGSLSETKAWRLASLVELVGYVPSSAAQSLRGRHTNTIGIAIPLSSISSGFYLEILAGIRREAEILGYQQFIFDVTTESARDDFFATMPFLGIVDGLIAVGLYIDPSRLRILERHELPVAIVLNQLTSPPVVSNVLTKNVRALQDLIDHHLIKHHRYRRLALVTLGTSNPIKMGGADTKDWGRVGQINAYKEALRLNGIEYCQQYVIEVEGHSFEEGYRAFNHIHDLNHSLPWEERIQAVVCTSDTLAAAILTAARRSNTGIPVTGFDNLPLAELLDITTIDQRAKDVGRTVFRNLYNAMSFHRRKGHLPQLVEEAVIMRTVIRCSCGCSQ